MSVPMSQYEALLEEVRCLRRKTQHVQQLAAPLISSTSTAPLPNASANYQISRDAPANVDLRLDFAMESVILEMHKVDSSNELIVTNGVDGDVTSEDECGRASSTHMSVSSEPISQKTRGMAALYHGTWPVERTTMWNSEPTNLGPITTLANRLDQASLMSFASSSGGAPLDRVLSSPNHSRRSSQQLEAKVDMVYSLLAMLGGQEHADMGETLLALSTSPESCLAMRQSGCIPLLVQLVQSDKDGETRRKASQALHNLVHSQPDEKLRKRETRVLSLLEQARLYTEAVKNDTEIPSTSDDEDKHPVLTVAHIMKLSFDEGHRQAICQLGGIHIIANLVETEHTVHGSTMEDTQCVLMRRYACMALTNLTFGDSGNKALLCSFREFMRALVIQLQSPSDELRQVTASVLRNLSWRADPVSKEILREVETVTGLMRAAMVDSKENTLKSILSALWNLSAHCTENKAEICAIAGALGFLVDMLSYKTPSKSLAVIENSGGILRNISSQIAVRDDYREILRKHNCLQVLLEQLKSPSLTIVSNACGTLWNLSAKNAQDQEALWQMGAPAMLRSLNHSKHKMIAMGSSAALKNLLSSRPSHAVLSQMDATARAMDLPVLPTLGARKQKALLQDLDQSLLETFDNIDSPTKSTADDKLFDRTEKYIPTNELLYKSHRTKHTMRSESHECLSHTELVYESRTSSSAKDLLRLNEHLSRRDEHLLDKERSPWSDDGECRREELLGHRERSAELLVRQDDYASGSDDLTHRGDHLSQAFASLNLNEPCASYQKDLAGKTRLIQNFGSTSLPYVNSKCSGTYIPVRNKYSDCEFEDEIDVADQPIDFSRKYAEIKGNPSLPSNQGGQTAKYYDENPKITNRNDSYGIYAETDLDQPTDYSLRYAEDDSDSDCDKMSKHEFVQDSVKTYCTEGTPYETPFNFSTATSMSDLRIDAAVGDAEKVIDNDKLATTTSNKNEVKIPVLSHLDDEKDHCSVEDISEAENRPKSDDKISKSEFSSGLMSPEKPVNYCEEGTPGYFSRVSSFGSINSIPAGETLKNKENDKEKYEEMREGDGVVKANSSPNEGAKAVKFEQTVNYAEETPLMFSRSSSLASLDSVEQHSIHDDRSSVVSDFSRLTSGIVSPSELPDSPTQTVPPSPKPRKGPLEYPSTSRGPPTLFPRTAADGRPQPAPRSVQKPSVFEDNITKFKEESTPVQFSTATSLSSLTIDDHDEPTDTQIRVSPPVSQRSESTVSPMPNGGGEASNKEDGSEKQDTQKEKENGTDLSDDFIHISEDEDDDDILADCISIGMQNNRHRQSKDIPVPAASKLPTSPYKCSAKSQSPRPQGSSIPLPRTGIPTRSSSGGSSRIIKPDVPGDSLRTYCTEDTPAVLSQAGSNSDLSTLSIPNDSKKGYLSDESSNLSGENDNILAECIQSAMPKAKKPVPNKPAASRQIPTLSRNVTTSTPIKPFSREPAAKNEQKIRISKEDVKRSKMPAYLNYKENVDKFSAREFSDVSQSALQDSVGGLTRASVAQHVEVVVTHRSPTTKQLNTTDEQNSNLSGQDSLSSLSVESLGSLETEQALLEQCISSGMPKSKTESPQKSIEKEKPIGVATKQFSSNSKIKYEDRGLKHKQEAIPKIENKEKKTSNSKNVYVASAVENTVRTENKGCPEITATIAGVELAGDSGNDQRPSPVTPVGTSAPADMSQDKYLPTSGNLSTDPKKNGYDDRKIYCVIENCAASRDGENVTGVEEVSDRKGKQSEDCSPEKSYSITDNSTNKYDGTGSNKCNDSTEDIGNIVDNRMLDPDAMIESLDRFTAELVSQAACHLQNKEDNKFQASVTEGDTWNEDVSPNDVTFPSMSGSAPNVITFESDSNDLHQRENFPDDFNDIVDGLNDGEQKSNDFSSMNTSTLTESTLIAMEAAKMATTFRTEAMSQSAASLELDLIQPPSQLHSLTNSILDVNGGLTSSAAHELEMKGKRSPKLSSRKKSLQAGLMVRRALSNSVNQTSSVESLENNSLSNLDHMNPPSAMGEVLDLLDLEGSMTSVASLQSEVADVKSDFLMNGIVNRDAGKQIVNHVFNVKQSQSNTLHLLANNSPLSFTELENINPPSIFNEITDMCNSLADIPTEAICSETEIFEDCYTHVETNLQTDTDLTEFSDANSITPLHSDPSSSETTPKRVRHLQRMLTPKQRRNLAKERYKTYTVAAEMVMRDEQCSGNVRVDDFEPGNGITSNVNIGSISTNAGAQMQTRSKTTPKERRQKDPSRFQTRVLEETFIGALPKKGESSAPTCLYNKPLKSGGESPVSSPTNSPAKPKLGARRNFLQRRLENRDRFRTKTLSESSLSPELLGGSPTNVNANAPDLHLLLQKEADVVLKTLNEAKSRPDELLDCETLSLVSNEDDSEHNSGSSINYRTYHKSWGFSSNNIPVIQSSAADLENYERGNLNNDRKNDVTESGYLNQNTLVQHNLDQSLFDRTLKHDIDEISLEQITLEQTSDPDSDVEVKAIGKPKIVKPSGEQPNAVDDMVNVDCQGKGIRGRRKPLYTRTNMGSRMLPKSVNPNKSVSSSLVKNVTSTLKNGTSLKLPQKLNGKSLISKPPIPQTTAKMLKLPANYSTKQNSNQTSQTNKSPKHSSQIQDTQRTKPTIERQGTFTKDDVSPKSKIPTHSSVNSGPPNSTVAPVSSIPKPSSRIARPLTQSNSSTTRTVTNKGQSAVARQTGRTGIMKSASTDRANKVQTSPSRNYGRSPSADARDVVKRSSLQSSPSNQSLKSGAVKRSSAPESTHRSSSSSSVTSNGSAKQITSRIASLWKKVEESKRQTPSRDTRVWIQPEMNANDGRQEESPRLIRSNTFDNKDAVILHNVTDVHSSKHISQLSSYVAMNERDSCDRIQYERNGIVNQAPELSF